MKHTPMNCRKSVRTAELYIDGKWIPTLHDVGWLVAGLFTLFASAVALYLLWMHAAYYHKPHEQRHIARILLMLPIYSIISLLSYVFYPWAMAYNTISSAYEALALCSFFLLLRNYLSSDIDALTRDLRLRTITYWAWPLSYIRIPPMNGLTWYWIIAFGISQYALLRPCLAVLAIVLDHYNLYCEASVSPRLGFIYIFVLQSISVGVAMFFVVSFYLELKREPALKRNNPFMKLVCIKLVVFLVFWQGVLLQLCTVAGIIKDSAWSAKDIQNGIGALLTCAEMAIFAILHLDAYSYKAYIGERTPRYHLLLDTVNLSDYVLEFWRASRWVLYTRQKRSHIALDPIQSDYAQLRTTNTAQRGLIGNSTSSTLQTPSRPVKASLPGVATPPIVTAQLSASRLSLMLLNEQTR